MISAEEARSLLIAPLLSLDAVEADIKEAAKTRDWKCYLRPQLAPELRAALTAQGFDVRDVADEVSVMVSWGKREAVTGDKAAAV
jgi:hypothetical protein